MKQKDLDKEGITKEFLSTISAKKLGNPVQLLPNDEPVNLVKCLAGFWVSVNGQLLTDNKNNYLVVSNKEAEIGRARYLINFKEQIAKQEGEIYKAHLEKQIQKEVERLQELTRTTTKNYLNGIKLLLQFSGHIEEDFGFTLQKIAFKEQGSLEEKISEAKKLTSEEDYLDLYIKLSKQIEDENWDSLYVFFFQKGLPEIATFEFENLFNSTDMSVLTKFFHRDKLEQTISEINSSSHIENVAKFNIEKLNAKNT